MSLYEVDERLTDFTIQLTARAREAYRGDQVAHAALLRALDRGWTARALARHCSHDLPLHGAGAAVQRQLVWCADHSPQTTQRPARAQRAVAWCERCADESYRWEVDAEGRPLRPCPRCHPSAVAADGQDGTPS